MVKLSVPADVPAIYLDCLIAGATCLGDPEACVTEVAMGLRPIASSGANESEFDKRCSSRSLLATLSAVVTAQLSHARAGASFMALIYAQHHVWCCGLS